MLKVNVKEDCGNAPKKEIVRDLLIAGANENENEILKFCTDDVKIEFVGFRNADGKEEAVKFLHEDSAPSKVVEITIENILSHGDKCSANGVLKFDDGNSVAFNNLYVFENYSKDAKVKEIKVYSVILK